MPTERQLGLARTLIGLVTGDRAGTITEEKLAIAIGTIDGTYVPFGENDVVAIPVPYGAPTEVCLSHEKSSLFPMIAAIVETGTDATLLIRYDELDRSWTVVADGNIRHVQCVDGEEDPAYVRIRDVQEIVCWGEGWEVPVPTGAQWRARVQVGSLFEDDERMIKILAFGMLIEQTDGIVLSRAIDASNVTPPWRADEPQEWKVVRRKGIPYLERHGEPSRAIGGEETLAFVSGEEAFTVDWVESAGPGFISILCVMTDECVELRDHHITVTDIKATRTHLVVTFVLRGREHDIGHRGSVPQILVLDRTTRTHADNPPGQPADERWHPAQKTKEAETDNGTVVLVEMTRRDERDRVIEHGVHVLTDRGQIFHRLRGTKFDHLQMVGPDLWGWRRTPGGIILSRYPLPRD